MDANFSIMIFAIQRYIEDYFAARGLRDPDQFAVKVANLYDMYRNYDETSEDFLSRLHRTRTAFFASNRLTRKEFERKLVQRLDREFLKKNSTNSIDQFPGDVSAERTRLRTKPRSIGRILDEFRAAVEARAIDPFWESRKKNRLTTNPERIGQALLAVFIRGVLDGKGLSFREVGSGIGFVDIVVVLSTVPHLLELKVIRSEITGANQLQSYMRTEVRNSGWLVLFDARPHEKRYEETPSRIDVPEGCIRVLSIDINPIPPSAYSKSN